ncbi:MAG TPA: FG-GAP-like repeat-containing protein, partial [Usitatibacteraceae bacterium]|nr:FG-GAP-like repeat-containing protein [Usitatibacteraceae bacterium]
GMAATGVLGQPDFSSRLVDSGPASLNVPTGLAVDRLGNVFVVDVGERLAAFDRPFALPAVRGDADDDRKADLFWRTVAPGTGLSWWTMNGSAATAANYHDVDPAWQVADVGDLDGDGKADLVWRRASDGATYLWLLDGFVFKGFADLGVLDPAAWTLVGTGDLNGDGKDDVIWRGADGTVYAWLMNGGVIASQGVISNPGTVWVIADLADMDGDGKADIVFRNATDGGIYVYFMNGLAIASGGYVGAVDPAIWTLVGAADFNGDGKADFLWRHTSGDTWVWLMDGASFVSAGGIGNPGTSWIVRSMGDFDGDGKSDLVWRHTDGTTYLWRMNGLTVSAFEPIANPGGTWEVVAP